MGNTFGTWMKDTARLNDERIWVAEHFSGGLVRRQTAWILIENVVISNPGQGFVCSSNNPTGMLDYTFSNQLYTFCFLAGRSDILLALPQVVR